jgi:hypothetical protein
MMVNNILKQMYKHCYEVGFDDRDLIQAENERLNQPQEAVVTVRRGDSDYFVTMQKQLQDLPDGIKQYATLK